LKVMMALLLTSGYLLLNTAWSLSPWDALSAVAEFFVIIAVLHLIANMLVASEDRVLRAMAAGVVTSVIMAGALLCLDVFSGQWPRRAILSYIPALRLHARHLVVENGWVASALPHVLNRSISASGLLRPALLIIDRLALAPIARLADLGAPSRHRGRIWLCARHIENGPHRCWCGTPCSGGRPGWRSD
jgi:hypothetical protein